MLQQNSFFSQASIFFGPNIEADDEQFEESELEMTHFVLDTEFASQQEIHIGLFFDWSPVEEG